jgi:hypothetical protein
MHGFHFEREDYGLAFYPQRSEILCIYTAKTLNLSSKNCEMTFWKTCTPMNTTVTSGKDRFFLYYIIVVYCSSCIIFLYVVLYIFFNGFYIDEYISI